MRLDRRNPSQPAPAQGPQAPAGGRPVHRRSHRRGPVAITTTMQADVATKLDEYGANILIVPKANDLSLSYGG